MVGPTVSTASVGQPITAGMYNQLTTLLTVAPLVRVTTTAAQSTSASINTNLAILWNTETYDDYGMHDNTTNTSRLVVPTGWAGYYRATALIRGGAATTSTANLVAQFAINGSARADTLRVLLSNTVNGVVLVLSDVFSLQAGDYVEVACQSNTASQPIATANCSFALEFIHI